MRWKNSTAVAGQPVTSRASCSSTRAVPLRRRYARVLATQARMLTPAEGTGRIARAPTRSPM
mgnify:CR=1 FL=1